MASKLVLWIAGSSATAWRRLERSPADPARRSSLWATLRRGFLVALWPRTLSSIPPKRAPYYALKDQNGRTITPALLRGKAVAVTFLSSVCKEQCPLIGVTMRLVRRQLGAASARLSVVVISVDPEQDSAANTAAFARDAGWQGTDWHYLSAPRSVLTPIWAEYGIYVPAPSPIFKPGQTIVHQAGST